MLGSAVETLGRALRTHRMRAGLSQAELAGRAAIGVRTLRNLEQDRIAAPRASSVRQVASALGLDGADVDGLLAMVGDGGGPRVGVLGPLTVSRDGAWMELPSPRLRRLLGLLALWAGRAVPHHEIVEVLWEHDPPKSYRGLVQLYVGQLRDVLEPGRERRAPGRVLAHTAGRYRLRLDPGRLDLTLFDELADRGLRALDQGDHGTARDLLDRALACWRGPVLADLGDRLGHHPVAVAASRKRASAVLAYADLADEPPHDERALARLRALADEEPLHEVVAARLGRALARAGEQAAALALFAEVRARLADELGIEPGAELRTAHLQVLRQQVSGHGMASHVPVRPAQLPADAAGFTGRADQLDELDRVLRKEGPRVVAVTGPGGIGKTALAVHWAHRVRDEFPDGQLYVDLRGFATDRPVRPIDALTGFLHTLGCPRDQEPVDTDRAAALYRSLLADKRMLVVLDNARDAGHVRPLLPGSAGSLTLVTSRDRLAGLVARDGARRVPVGMLTEEEARALLEHLVGPERVTEERDAATELVDLCGRLPLALRVAGANVTGRAGGLAAAAARLRTGDRLVALAADGDEQAAVRASFDLSYAALAEPRRRLFRLLGLVPGADVTPEAAAALAGVTPDEAARSLDRLAGAHLVEERSAGRYGLHDLLRLYAAEHAAGEDAGPLFDWYLHTADAAARLLYPHMQRLPLPASPHVEFPSHAEALRWLDAERHNLIAVVEHAVAHGPAPVAWQLADVLHGYFWLRMYTVDWLAVAGGGLEAARSAGDPRAEAACELSLANAHMRASRYRQAVEHANRSLTRARSAGWPECQAAAVNNLGIVAWQSGRLREAVAHLGHALALNRRTGQVRGEAANLGNLAIIQRELGRLRVSVAHVTAAMAITRQTSYRVGEANGHTQLGKLAHDLGRFDIALAELGVAVHLNRELGNRGGEADALCTLAKVHRDAGGGERVRVLAAETVALATETTDRQVEAGALATFASVYLRLGRREEAAGYFRRALDLATATGNRYPEIEALVGLADCLRGREAVEYARRARNLSRLGGYRVLEGQALTSLAAARLELRRPDLALPAARVAVEIQRETGHRLGEAHAHRVLGRVYAAVGLPGAAETASRRATTLFRQIGAPEV